MNLTELIRLNNRLSGLTVTDLKEDSSDKVAWIMHQLDVPLAGIDNSFQQQLEKQHLVLQNSFSAFEHELLALKKEVQTHIEREGNAWLQRSYTLYEQQINSRSAQSPEALKLHRNKPTNLNSDIEAMLKVRVASYCDWHHPAMIFHPMTEPFIHQMVSADPLYVVDESHYLLEPALTQFNQVYQNRLRPYVIDESFDWPILDQLPNQQFGFCLAYNYLNYKPFEIIKKYLEELYQKLLPGGTLAFTFNDCDRYQAMQAVEQDITSYTPGSLIRGWAEYIGFTEVFCYNDNGPWSWIEYRKPGKLTSLRGGQSLAKIIPKPVKYEEPKPIPKPIAELTLNELRERVLALNQYEVSQVRYGFTELKLKAILEAQPKEN
jgi:SAM-dependent methyltransferase